MLVLLFRGQEHDERLSPGLESPIDRAQEFLIPLIHEEPEGPAQQKTGIELLPVFDLSHVPDEELAFQPFFLELPFGKLDEGRGDVHPDHVVPFPSEDLGLIPTPAAQVENAFPGMQSAGCLNKGDQLAVPLEDPRDSVPVVYPPVGGPEVVPGFLDDPKHNPLYC